MNERLIAFLKRLHREFPTEGQRHNLTLDDEDRLVLSIWREDRWFKFHVEIEDMQDIDRDVVEIRQLLDNSELWHE